MKNGVEFLDQSDLSTARAWRVGEEIILEEVKVQDKAPQEPKGVDMHVRWLPDSQAFGIVSSSDR